MLKFVSQRSFGEFAWHRVSADHDLGRPTVLSYLVLWEGTPDCAERSEPPLGDPVHPRFFEVRSNQARQGRHRLTLGAFPPSRRNRCVGRYPQLIDGKTLTLNYTFGTGACFGDGVGGWGSRVLCLLGKYRFPGGSKPVSARNAFTNAAYNRPEFPHRDCRGHMPGECKPVHVVPLSPVRR